VPAGTEAIVSCAIGFRTTRSLPYGLHARSAKSSDSADARIVLAPGETRTVQFRLHAPGTYFYWRNDDGPADRFIAMAWMDNSPVRSSSILPASLPDRRVIASS